MTVPPGVTLLVGGARSGKSTLAVQLGLAWPGPVTFVATARTDPADADLTARIARHRAERPATWTTVETDTEVPAAVRDAPADALVIVDCVTLWVAACFEKGGAEGAAAELAEIAAARTSPTVVVSNEAGLGVVPAVEIARVYRDVLGRVNTALATRADRTLFLVAGRAVRLDDPWRLLA